MKGKSQGQAGLCPWRYRSFQPRVTLPDAVSMCSGSSILKRAPLPKSSFKIQLSSAYKSCATKSWRASVSTHLAGEEVSRGKSLQVPFYLFSSLLKQATSARSLLALLSWLCSQQTHPSPPHGSANMHKRHKRQDGNEEFGHTTVSL